MLRLKPPRRPPPNGPTPTTDILHEHRRIFLMLPSTPQQPQPQDGVGKARMDGGDVSHWI